MSLFLGSADKNYNAALQIFGNSSIFADYLCLLTVPPNAVRETYGESLECFSQRTCFNWCMVFNKMDHPFLGYSVEAAHVDDSKEILDLMRSDEERSIDKTLH